MVYAAWAMLALPLLGFLVLLAFGRRLGDPVAGWVGTGSVAGSFVATLVTFGGVLSRHAGGAREISHSIFTWIAVGGLDIKAAILTDPLSMTMALFVTGVSALIHLYSIGYMKGDRDYSKFFVYLNLFVFSMLLLVLGGNLAITFVGWEGVGLCSYWLIAFWFERPTAASAGKKAFVYNRIGDFGFLIAMFLIFEKTGTLSYSGIFAHLHALSGAAGTAAVLLLFLAATGKSAQIPLFPWLADAMEGPTPVSALIHAATMVTAGVYLMCRMHPLLGMSHSAQLVVATIGVVTAFVGGTIACTQRDIKKVLAYSTISQLGYMFLAVGVGAYVAAIFLMVAHAFYKGLLFLGAGSVIHGMHDEQDLKKMGGLARFMPITAGTFAVAWFAIAGVPPLAGFFAKGAVLDNTFAAYPVLWVIGIVTALLTAYYLSRLFVLAFTGDPRFIEAVNTRWSSSGSTHSAGADGYPSPHESPRVMVIPLLVLAVLAFAGGVLELPWHGPDTIRLLSWLHPVFGHYLYTAHLSVASQWILAVVDSLVALSGIYIAWRLWTKTWDRPKLEPSFLFRSWFVNEAYDLLIGRPGDRLASFTTAVVEARVVDGAVNGVAVLTRNAGGALRKLQTGFVRQYALGITLGLVALLAWMLVRA
ncbi:MAG: NADH-quinone oxidoreductase subunit L [Actinobacteria bacterium]|nr:NADH-quinone oxidoreductase subunit L [Actinomycetota bacterium]